MRLWTLHPKYLDPAGLTALWREALLAKHVLLGKTRGYRHHPQLRRFQAHPSPVAAIETFLATVHAEALSRGYRFDASKLGPERCSDTMAETRGQLEYERSHLLSKLATRSPSWHETLATVRTPEPNPLFHIVPGPVQAWEVIPGTQAW